MSPFEFKAAQNIAANGQLLLQVGYFITPSPEPLPIEYMKLKLITKSQMDIRLPEQKYIDAAEVSTSSPTCSDTNVNGLLFMSPF